MIPGLQMIRWCGICYKRPANWNLKVDIEGEIVPMEACDYCFETKVDKVG